MDDQKEFITSVDKATLKIINEMMSKMKLAALTIEASAKKNCNVDNGVTRASIFSDAEFNKNEIVGIIGCNVDNAPYLEKGTGIYAVDGNGRQEPWNWKNQGSKKWGGRKSWKGSRPHPFLEPARDENKDKVLEILSR